MYGLPSRTTWGVSVGGNHMSWSQSSGFTTPVSGTVSYSYDSPTPGSGGSYVCTSGCSGSVSPNQPTASASYTFQSQQKTVYLDVYVVDSSSGSPISGASLFLDEKYVQSSNTDGKLALTFTHPPETHSYRITANGYQDASGSWTIGTNSGGSVTVRLTRSPPQESLTVKAWTSKSMYSVGESVDIYFYVSTDASITISVRGPSQFTESERVSAGNHVYHLGQAEYSDRGTWTVTIDAYAGNQHTSATVTFSVCQLSP